MEPEDSVVSHFYIEFANSVDKAQSPLYFAELYWAELSHFHDVVQLRVIQNMTTQISFGL